MGECEREGRGGYLLRAARSSLPTSMRRLRSLRKRVTYRGKGEERGEEGGVGRLRGREG